MLKNYRFEIKGTARNDQTWCASGTLFNCEFNESFDHALRSTFEQLTNGKAVYGQPGKGCAGPYEILSVTIELVKQ
jgi:hypothetical protein